MKNKEKLRFINNDKLKTYSALACSLAAISNVADAQIVYTDIDNVLLLNWGCDAISQSTKESDSGD